METDSLTAESTLAYKLTSDSKLQLD